MVYVAVVVVIIVVLANLYIMWRDNFKEESRILFEGYYRKRRENMRFTELDIKELRYGGQIWDERVCLGALDEIERLREALIYISNFADEDVIYMVDSMKDIADEALARSE